jgi:prepilin-type N-terminal cleavage/methylation domain-containing protein
MKLSKAFTLVEVMVVVSIIGTLSSTILAGLVNAREKAIVASAVRFEGYNDRLFGLNTYLKFTFDNAASPFADSSGNNYNGNLNLAACPLCGTDASTPFPNGKSYRFEGNSTLLSTITQPISNNDYTVSVWVNPTNFNSAGFLASLYFADIYSQFALKLIVNSSSIMVSRDADVLIHTTPLQTGNWTLLTMTYTGSTNLVTLYVNGRPVKTQTFAQIPAVSPISVVINGTGFPNTEFYGKIDNFAIYGQSLTARQIQNIYAKELKSHKKGRELAHNDSDKNYAE